MTICERGAAVLEDPIVNEGTRGLEAEPVMTSGPVESEVWWSC